MIVQRSQRVLRSPPLPASALDIKVDDFDVAERAVLALGASKTGSESQTFRVYRDPAGHPFCLIKPPH